LGHLWLYERKPAEEKSLSLPVPDHIPVASTEEEIAMHLAQQA
jgi:hypothetical protein